MKHTSPGLKLAREHPRTHRTTQYYTSTHKTSEKTSKFKKVIFTAKGRPHLICATYPLSLNLSSTPTVTTAFNLTFTNPDGNHSKSSPEQYKSITYSPQRALSQLRPGTSFLLVFHNSVREYGILSSHKTHHFPPPHPTSATTTTRVSQRQSQCAHYLADLIGAQMSKTTFSCSPECCTQQFPAIPSKNTTYAPIAVARSVRVLARSAHVPA